MLDYLYAVFHFIQCMCGAAYSCNTQYTQAAGTNIEHPPMSTTHFIKHYAIVRVSKQCMR